MTGRSSSHRAASHRSGSVGGERAGRGAGISAGSPRCRSIRSITAACSMRAINRKRPPHRGLPEPQPHLPVGRHAEPLLRHGRAQRVAAHLLEPIALPRRHDTPRMQVEPVGPRVTPARRGRRVLLGRIPETTDTHAPRPPSATRPCTDAAAMPASTGTSSANRSAAASPSPRPRRSSRRAIRGSSVASTSATSRSEGRRGMKHHPTRLRLREHTVQHEGMKMRIEIEAPRISGS